MFCFVVILPDCDDKDAHVMLMLLIVSNGDAYEEKHTCSCPTICISDDESNIPTHKSVDTTNDNVIIVSNDDDETIVISSNDEHHDELPLKRRKHHQWLLILPVRSPNRDTRISDEISV